jgi:hypothetical protein
MPTHNTTSAAPGDATIDLVGVGIATGFAYGALTSIISDAMEQTISFQDALSNACKRGMIGGVAGFMHGFYSTIP